MALRVRMYASVIVACLSVCTRRMLISHALLVFIQNVRICAGVKPS